MLQEIEMPVITEFVTVSPSAAQAVNNILAERKLDGYALRVFVSNGGGCGCSGVNFGMALDNNFRDIDTTFQAGGVQIVVDSISMEYLRGASIDFVNDPDRGAGFVVDSPMAGKKEGHGHAHGEAGCGCGNGEGSCGCGGGSCGCNN